MSPPNAAPIPTPILLALLRPDPTAGGVEGVVDEVEEEDADKLGVPVEDAVVYGTVVAGLPAGSWKTLAELEQQLVRRAQQKDPLVPHVSIPCPPSRLSPSIVECFSNCHSSLWL